ncbi:MAG: amidohydrolase [Candidatus Obscuribacter sp.]|nr:amidohydrolase [Candidatus Obscuribacter sp.]
MRKIDIHTHILPRDLPDWQSKFGYGGFIQLDHHKPCCARMIRDDGKFFRDVEANLCDADARIIDLDETDVKQQVLSTVPVMFSYWAKAKDCYDLSRFLNDHMATVVQAHPHRFYGLGTIPMQDTDLAVKELTRCVKELGLSGVQIGSHVEQYNLSDERLFPVFEAAQELGAAIFVHPWSMMGEEKMTKYWLPWLVGMPAEVSLAICSMIFGGVFERLPALRVAFAHGGGSFPLTLGRITHGYEARPDLCAIDNAHSPAEYIGRFFVDSLVHDPRAFKYILELFGPDHICIGSDYPFPLGEARPGAMLESMHLAQDVKQKLFYGSALKWLGLTEDEGTVLQVSSGQSKNNQNQSANQLDDQLNNQIAESVEDRIWSNEQ